MNELRQLIREKKSEDFFKLSQQYDIYSCDHKGNTLLHEAAQHNARDIADFLLRKNLNPNVCNFKHLTPLHMAAMFNNTETALLILQSGANPNQRTTMNVTALHYAAQRSNHELAEALIKKGADLHAQTTSGATPYNLANMESGLMINTILKEANIFGNIVVTEEDPNKIIARPDLFDIGLIPFSPELVSNPNVAKRKCLDGYFYSHFRYQPVQIRVVNLPNLSDQNKELLLHSVTELRAFATPVIDPAIGIIFFDNNYSYGIMVFSSSHDVLSKLVEEDKMPLTNVAKLKICTHVSDGVHFLLNKTNHRFSNIYLNPSTITYDPQAETAKIEVFTRIPFDIYSSNIHFPEFTAPEILVSTPSTRFDPQSSLTYSLGAIFMYLFMDGPLFKDMSEFEIGTNVADSYYTGISPYPKIFMNEDVNKFVEILLIPNPIGRNPKSFTSSSESFKPSRPFIWQLNNVAVFKILMDKVLKFENTLDLMGNESNATIPGAKTIARISDIKRQVANTQLSDTSDSDQQEGSEDDQHESSDSGSIEGTIESNPVAAEPVQHPTAVEDDDQSRSVNMIRNKMRESLNSRFSQASTVRSDARTIDRQSFGSNTGHDAPVVPYQFSDQEDAHEDHNEPENHYEQLIPGDQSSEDNASEAKEPLHQNQSIEVERCYNNDDAANVKVNDDSDSSEDIK